MVNPYPYFAYQSDPRPETLAFCLFQPNSGRPDPGSGVTYTNMFDAQVAAVRAALAAAGFPGVEVVVAETGWPYRGDPTEQGATLENAKAYNGNLVAHLRAMAKPVETYIFAMYDEDLKPGPLSERSFGLFKPDLTPIYDAGLLKAPTPTESATPASPLQLPPPPPSPQVQPPPPAPTQSSPSPGPSEGNTLPQAPAVNECGAKGGNSAGGGTCVQPAVQNLPVNSDKNGAAAGRRRLYDTCSMQGLEFALLILIGRIMLLLDS